MSTFKFVQTKVTDSYSGGIPTTFLYENGTGAQTPIPGGTTVLDFTGNATGTVFAIGVVGGDGNDILTGLDGNDIFTGGKGDDTISGGIGSDQLNGGLGANTIDGGAGSDIANADFSDQAGDVVAVNGGVAGIKYDFTVGGKAYGSVINVEMMTGLTGGGGNDRLGGVYSLASRDSGITGGLGTDTAVVDLSADVSGGLSGGFKVGFIYNNTTGRQLFLSGLEVLEYTGNATGTGFTTGIVGGDGNDILIGLDGNDIFTGGKGDDTITGKGGNDQLYGGLGANTIDGGADYDIASADFSDQSGDVLALNGGVTGKTYSFTVAGKAHGSITDIELMTGLTGGKGNDRLGGVYTLASQASAISGGDGTDTAVLDLSADVSGGFSGSFKVGFIYNNNTGRQLFLTDMEVLEYTGNATGTGFTTGIVGGDGNDILTGLDGNDVFTGGKGNDTITGGKGDDSLSGGTGANTIEGGVGYDVADADFSDQTSAVVALNLGALDTKYDFTVGGAKFGSVRNIEMMTGLVGGSGDDRLGGVYTLTKQHSTISGGGGTDTAVVDLSADTTNSFSGGVGTNQFIYSNSIGYFLYLTDMEVLEFTGNATGGSYNAGILGAAGNDILTGLALNDVFNGAGGNDKITGAAGNDSLAGGTGANTIDGGADYDVASADFSDQTSDVVVLNFGVGGVKYDFTVGGKAFGSVVNVEMMTGLTGGKGNDRLGGVYTTTSQHSTISGGDGTDTAVVDLSADTVSGFSGGLGAKLIYNNTIGYQVNLTDMEVLEFTGNAVSGSYAVGIVGGDFNDILTGLDGNDIFTGGKGDDKITGGKGDDSLAGGTGANAIEGGAGYDVASADFSDQTGAVVALNFGVADTTYHFIVGGAQHGFVRNIEMMTGLTGGKGDDRLGGVYTLTKQHLTISGGDGIDTAVVDLSADTKGGFSGGLGAGIIYNNVSGYGINLTGMEVLEFTGNAVNGSYANGIVGGAGADILTGLGGNDTFTGQGGNDIITGAAGNDILSGGTGANTIDGGADYDIADADFSDQTGDVVAVNGGVAGVVYKFTVGGKAFGSVTNVEMMTGLAGGTGNDRLGTTYLLTSQNAAIAGGGGTDTAVIDLSSDTTGTFSGGAGAGIIYNNGTGFFISLSSIEALEYTGNAVSGSYNSGIVGGGGADILTGLGKADIFRGGGGNDRVRGNGADDQLFGDAGDDIAVFGGDFASYTFSFPSPNVVTVVGPDGNDTLTDFEILGFDDGEVEVVGGVIGNSFTITPATISAAEGQTGTAAYTFTVTRTGLGLTKQTIGFSVAGVVGAGTVPASATDFAGGVLPAGTVTFVPGQNSQTITVAVKGDTAVENNERFAVTLTKAPIAATITPSTAQGVIVNDDASLSIAALAASKAEGQSGITALTFSVTRSGDTSVSHSASFAVTGSGANPAAAADFAGAALPGGTVSFAAGETSKTITVNVTGDTAVETDEGFTVTLSAPSTGATFGTATATGTIVNDDASLSIAALAASKAEGQSGSTALTFTVTRGGDTSVAHSVTFAVTGSGANPAAAVDFAGGALPGGTVTFAVGQTSQTVTVNVAGDTGVEVDDGLTVTLSAPSAGATLGTATATGTILNDDALLSIAALAASKAEGQSGSTALTFTVTRSGDTSVAHSAKFAVAGSSAAPADATDFAGGALPSGTVNFIAGQTNQTVTVNVAGDTAMETDEGFTITLSAPSTGATLGIAAATGTIVNDDLGGGATLSIAATAASKAEGQSGSTALTFTVTRSGDTSVSHSAKFAVAGSGAAPAAAADFTGGALPSGTVNFAPGQTSQTVTVNVAGDTGVEADEGFIVTLSAPTIGATLGTATATGTIVNDDAVLSIAALAASKSEGQSGSTALTFTVTRGGDTSVAHSAKFAVAGSGAAPAAAADFAGGALPSGTVNFAVGQTSQTVTVNVAGDTTVEADEGFTVTLSAPSAGATLGTAAATGTIINDDAAGTGTLSVARLQAARAEGQSGSTAFTFIVSRSGDKVGPAGASWAVTGGTANGTVAANGTDFTGGALPSGVVSFAANETSKTVTVGVAGDGAIELNESFIVTLANPMAGVALDVAAATGIIFNDDTPGSGTLSIARASAQKAEGHSVTTAFTFTVTRSGDTTAVASADWAVTGGGVSSTIAANAADFAGGVLPSGRVNFAVGQTSQTVTVNVAGDTAIELNDSFTVTLGGLQAGVTLGTASATGVILNDDVLPTGQLSIAPLHAARSEGQSGSSTYTFVVTRSGNTAGPASAVWTVAGDTQPGANSASASDFGGGVLLSRLVSFTAGQTSQIIGVPVAGDATVEADETFTVTLSAAPAGVLLVTASATGTIYNDDTPGTGALSIARASASKPEGSGGATAFTFTVTRSGDLSGAAGVDLEVTGGGVASTNAANAADFDGGQLPVGHIVFAPGQSVLEVPVMVAADTLGELNESFTVTMSGAQAGVSITTATATGVILDDDTKTSTAASETLTGTVGPDLFHLGGGLDTVFGLAGLDQFRFQPSALGVAATNASTMEDFSRVDAEKLDLVLIDAIAGTATNDAFSFIGTAAFNGTPGQLRWEDQGAVRMIQGNVNNDNTADLTIFVKAAGPVDATWFVL